jgi:hypothetical protein
LGPGGLKVKLAPWDGDVFAIAPVSENEPKGSLSSITFTSPNDQPAESFVVQYLNANGLGKWVRSN